MPQCSSVALHALAYSDELSEVASINHVSWGDVSETREDPKEQPVVCSEFGGSECAIIRLES